MQLHVCRHHVALVLRLTVTSLLLTMTGLTYGQQPEGLPADWRKAEAAAETEYKQPLAEGNAVDAKIRGFLRDKALPQLALESNRTTIEKTRRRMRDFLLGGIEDAKAFDDVSRVILDFMSTLARDPEADAVVRVNALLLIGELRARDNKQPWPPAAPVLAAAVADAKLPAELRIAALVGLSRHVDAAKAAGTALADAKPVADALAAVISSPTAGTDPVAGNWLLSRALTVMPAAVPELSKELAAAITKVLEDGGRPIDVRVRAAAALGAAARPAAAIDAAKAVAAIRALAALALTQDLDRVAQQRAEETFTVAPAADPAASRPESQPRTTMAELACRRNAWRLVTLADALATEEGSAGLASLLGKAGDPARELAGILRTHGLEIDASPTEDAVREAATALGAKTVLPEAPATAPNAAVQPAATPDPPAGADNPFAK